MNSNHGNRRARLTLILLAFCELVMLMLTILLSNSITQLLETPEKVLRFGMYILTFLTILEIVFLFAIIKEKMGVIGIPISILRNYFFMISPFPCEIDLGIFLFLGGLVILLRLFEMLYLYKGIEHGKGLKGLNKLLLFSILMDCIAFSEIIFMRN